MLVHMGTHAYTAACTCRNIYTRAHIYLYTKKFSLCIHMHALTHVLIRHGRIPYCPYPLHRVHSGHYYHYCCHLRRVYRSPESPLHHRISGFGICASLGANNRRLRVFSSEPKEVCMHSIRCRHPACGSTTQRPVHVYVHVYTLEEYGYAQMQTIHHFIKRPQKYRSRNVETYMDTDLCLAR